MLMAVCLSGHAQKEATTAETTRVLLVLDCTQTMGQRWQSDTKLRVTQQVLTYLLDSLDDIEVALRVYGNQLKEADGTRLEVPFGTDNREALQRKLRTLVAGGRGKASTALSKTRGDFPKDEKARNIILLITDGQQQDKDFCTLAGQMQMSSNILRTFILCIDGGKASASVNDCGGMVTFLRNEEDYATVLRDMFYMTDRKAMATLSLVDESHRPYETEVPVVFFDHLSHAVKYSTTYVYPLEEPDTMEVDPLVMYDITFYTQPPIELSNILLKAGKHREIVAEGGQGRLSVSLQSKRVAWTQPNYPVLLRRQGQCETVATLSLDEQCTLLTGYYDVEVLTVPPTRIDNVHVFADKSTNLQIATPGQLALTKPKEGVEGILFAIEEGRLRQVCPLDPDSPTERLILMPGDYQIVLTDTDDNLPPLIRFAITSAQQTTITIE